MYSGTFIVLVMKQEYTITVYTENQIGLLNRIAIMFSRRKINIDSMNSSPSEIAGIHRFNIVIDETEEVVRKLVRQIEKQVDVLKAYYNTNEEIIWQEHVLYKVSSTMEAMEKVLVGSGARIICKHDNYTMLETTCSAERNEAITAALMPFGVEEMTKSGRIAIIKTDYKIHHRLKQIEPLD